mgnify:CR=1 FL=1
MSRIRLTRLVSMVMASSREQESDRPGIRALSSMEVTHLSAGSFYNISEFLQIAADADGLVKGCVQALHPGGDEKGGHAVLEGQGVGHHKNERGSLYQISARAPRIAQERYYLFRYAVTRIPLRSDRPGLRKTVPSRSLRGEA